MKSLGQVLKNARIKGRTVEEKKAFFIRFLMDSCHWGPFEHPSITFGIEGMSRVTMAQLTRHRLATFDVQSARVVNFSNVKFREIRWPPSFSANAVKSKAGLAKILVSKQDRLSLAREAFDAAKTAYVKLVEAGVPDEDARYLLPNAIQVHATMTINARSLMHVALMRTLGDAQWEIQELSNQLLAVARNWMPNTFKYFEKKFKGKRNWIGP